jgi:hypothetical protein
MFTAGLQCFVPRVTGNPEETELPFIQARAQDIKELNWQHY